MSRTARVAIVLLFFICSVWYCRRTIAEVIPSLGQPSDFNAYYHAAQNVIARQSPFVTRAYIYPPLLAVLLTPIAPLPYLAARWVWFLFSQACLLMAAWLMWRAIGRDWLAACTISFVWALGGAAPESLGLGQPGPELALLIAAGITLLGWRSATALATGFAIKFYPGVLAVGFLLRRQWRSFLVFAVASATLVLLPWIFVICCLDGPRTPGARDTWAGTPAPLSWGFPSVVLRILDPPTPGGPLPRDWENDLPYLQLPDSHRWASIATSAITLLIGFAILAGPLPHGRGSEAAAEPRAPASGSPMQPFTMAALVSLSLAASPVCWTHYQIVQYPGLALLLCHAFRSRQWGVLAAALAFGSLLYPLPVAVLTDYYMKYGKWTASLPTFYFWTSVAPFASMGLFGLFVREAKRQHE